MTVLTSHQTFISDKENVEILRNARPSISDFKVVSTIGRGHFGQVSFTNINVLVYLYCLFT